jgi:hypothetical protein
VHAELSGCGLTVQYTSSSGRAMAVASRGSRRGVRENATINTKSPAVNAAGAGALSAWKLPRRRRSGSCADHTSAGSGRPSRSIGSPAMHLLLPASSAINAPRTRSAVIRICMVETRSGVTDGLAVSSACTAEARPIARASSKLGLGNKQTSG